MTGLAKGRGVMLRRYIGRPENKNRSFTQSSANIGHKVILAHRVHMFDCVERQRRVSLAERLYELGAPFSIEFPAKMSSHHVTFRDLPAAKALQELTPTNSRRTEESINFRTQAKTYAT